MSLGNNTSEQQDLNQGCDFSVFPYFPTSEGRPIGGGYCIKFEIAQMALSYYLNKLLKDCFLNHHGWTGPESAARARGTICRTVKCAQMIQFAFGKATFIIRNVYKSVVYKEKFQCLTILQKSF